MSTATFGTCAHRGMLVDTDVLVWLFRGRESARAFVADAGAVELSAVTYMELAQGGRNKDELALLRRAVRLGGWQVIPLTEPISLRAVGLVEAYALPHGMRLADALVAATALERDQALATANARHYRFVPGIRLQRYRQ